MSRRLLQISMLILGLLTVALAGMSLIFGTANPLYAGAGIPDFPPLDSNLRFMGGMGLGLGLILIWILPTIERQAVLFRAVWFAAFLGGVGRLISVPVVGAPPPPILVFTIIEVVGVPFFIVWQNRIAASHRADRTENE